jgi:hypothetical protein
VNQTQKQHAVAIDLLKRLGLDNIKLEHQRDGRYSYRAWNTPIVEHNGSPPSARAMLIELLNCKSPSR